jgi:hypothetical protein
MKKVLNSSSRATAIAIAALIVAIGGSAVVAQAGQSSSPKFTKLALKNGWTGGPFSTRKPAVALINGVVVFKGAMSTTGTSTEAFKLPKMFRPSKNVYISVDLCNANYGRLLIEPTGKVFVQAETAFSNAQCFTSLDGASFAK